MEIVPLHKIPSKKEAEKIIRELTEKNKVLLSKHCKKRMRERGINIIQIINCLTKEKVTENPILANKRGKSSGYEITVERLTAGDFLKVVVCLRFSQTALVVTAMKIK